MKEFLMQNIKTRCEVIVAEGDVMRVLTILNKNQIKSNMSIEGVDGIWPGSIQWVIQFSATGKQMARIKAELKKENFKEIIVLTNTSDWVKVEKLA